MPVTGNLANHSVLMKLWLLEENQRPVFYLASMVPSNNLQTLILIPTGKCGLHSLSRKLLSTTDTITENYSQSKQRVVKPSPNRYFLKTSPHLKFKERCVRGPERPEKSENQRVDSETVSPSDIRSDTHEISITRLPNVS